MSTKRWRAWRGSRSRRRYDGHRHYVCVAPDDDQVRRRRGLPPNLPPSSPARAHGRYADRLMRRSLVRFAKRSRAGLECSSPIYWSTTSTRGRLGATRVGSSTPRSRAQAIVEPSRSASYGCSDCLEPCTSPEIDRARSNSGKLRDFGRSGAKRRVKKSEAVNLPRAIDAGDLLQASRSCPSAQLDPTTRAPARCRSR